MVFRGLGPSGVYAYDFRRRQLFELPINIGVSWFGLDLNGRERFSLSSRGVLARVQLTRTAAGTLKGSVQVDVDTELFGLQAHQVDKQWWLHQPFATGTTAEESVGRVLRIPESNLNTGNLSEFEL
jgi:hypothetical protein